MSKVLILDEGEAVLKNEKVEERMKELKQALLKTPAAKKRRLGLQEELDLMQEFNPTIYHATKLQELATAVDTSHKLLPMVVQAITQTKSEGNEVLDILTLDDLDIGKLPTNMIAPPSLWQAFQMV